MKPDDLIDEYRKRRYWSDDEITAAVELALLGIVVVMLVAIPILFWACG